MNTATRHAPFLLAPMAVLTLALAGCGGGSDDLALAPAQPAAAEQAQRALAQVRLDGCVVDEYYIPRTGTTVRMLGADGRLLGHAISDKSGAFIFQAPSQHQVSINVDKVDGEAMVVSTGQGPLSVTRCLRDAES